ncbi:hypothetical protein G4L39_06245 [Limisphaera ngatamarikiensis]|uniref:Type 4 fimbrial biogenesis protein PilX N-terminal domain-containing protein n=1 Tax=Limisphaera ngatamarikiensis TaxID=1324935 RepID=A0A6M1RH98_9BACT|nr:hypothetical protein [Limisphaera ngatamarikiensis]NGO38996.1 hypothetical protein [Limisphaera ngatamarikiensis]
MKVPSQNPRRNDGSALLMVMLMGGIGVAILAAAMSWTASTASLTERNLRYQEAVYAAEAATEKVLSAMVNDYSRLGLSVLQANMGLYPLRIPTPEEDPCWAGFDFEGTGIGGVPMLVEQSTPWVVTNLQSQYRGLSGRAATFRIRARAANLAHPSRVAAAVEQEVQFALVPIFQFTIFYNLDLEINPGATMTIGGRVHGNQNIYCSPASSLTFLNDVTASGTIFLNKHPDDPLIRSRGPVVFQGRADSGVMSLNIPIGVPNDPNAVRAIVEPPPPGEPLTSELAKERFYNKADLLLVLRDSGVEIRGGPMTQAQAVSLPWNAVTNFVSTNASFTDLRENKTVRAVEIDVGKFATWSTAATNPIRLALGRPISSVYVADLRTFPSSQLPAVRLVNGATLPSSGLTVATPNPLYILGHYNAPAAYRGTTNTTQTRPAAIIADAITILSPNWNDSKSAQSINNRIAADTTVNAAFMAGIVPTRPGAYSGGVENFPRFLENWSQKTLTYNGSMIVLYPSRMATNVWPGTGTVYNAPNRNWHFDLNFLNPDKLPPLCPSVRAVIRGRWQVLAASQ